MKNGDIEIFLDTGWYMESTLYYEGRVYWCEGFTDSDTGISTFFVDSWEAECPDGKFYRTYQDKIGEPQGYKEDLEIHGTDMEMLKKQFLIAPIFEGKSFWQVEKDLTWVDEGEPLIR
ncbi:MAG: hypothetical protein E7200_00980 [Selenomonas ruminantium]|nr:hypothetical protein [Selenomonas ruminantium]